MLAAVASAAVDDVIATIPNPQPEANSKFGYSVDAVNGDILAGAPLFNTGGNPDAGIAYRFGLGGALLYALNNPLPTNGDQYGFSIEGFGKHILVGAPFDEVAGASTGGAVHLHHGKEGRLLRSIASARPKNNSRFGWSVYTIKGKFIAGAPNDDGANDTNQAGAAYLLNKGSKSSTILPRDPKTTYLSPRPTPDDEFGFSVSALRQLVVVGAPSDDFTGSNSGAAYSYFARTGGLDRIFENPSPGSDDRFGFAVAAIEDNELGNDDNYNAQIAVGAPDDENGDSIKTGRVFVFDSASGVLQFTIEDPDPQVGARFGAAVHDAEGGIIVGAPGFDNNAGRAYVFNGQTGQLISPLNNPEPDSDDEFGFSVSKALQNVKGPVDPVHLLVGAPGDSVDGNSAAGTVYVYRGL